MDTNGTQPFATLGQDAYPAAEHTLEILGTDGRTLFAIHGDGSVTGAIEDASEAAAIFCREVGNLLRVKATA